MDDLVPEPPQVPSTGGLITFGCMKYNTDFYHTALAEMRETVLYPFVGLICDYIPLDSPERYFDNVLDSNPLQCTIAPSFWRRIKISISCNYPYCTMSIEAFDHYGFGILRSVGSTIMHLNINGIVRAINDDNLHLTIDSAIRRVYRDVEALRAEYRPQETYQLFNDLSVAATVPLIAKYEEFVLRYRQIGNRPIAQAK